MTKNKEIIINFLNQMAQQDNRATASPFYYTIATSKKDYCEAGCGDDTAWLIGDDYEEFENINEAARSLKEQNYDKNERRQLIEKAKEVGIKKVWSYNNMFLTETDAENHLKRNHYHYSSDAHTYVEHAWRAPELEEFLTALFEEFSIERINK